MSDDAPAETDASRPGGGTRRGHDPVGGRAGDSPPGATKLPIAFLAVAIVGLAIPAVLIAASYKACVGETTRGTLRLHNAEAGIDRRLRVTTCTADALDLAVTLAFDAPDTTAVARLDPLDGPAVHLRAGALDLRLTPNNCPGLRAAVRIAGRRDDGTPLLDGSAATACTASQGGTIVRVDLEAWFRACGMATE